MTTLFDAFPPLPAFFSLWWPPNCAPRLPCIHQPWENFHDFLVYPIGKSDTHLPSGHTLCIGHTGFYSYTVGWHSFVVLLQSAMLLIELLQICLVHTKSHCDHHNIDFLIFGLVGD